MRIIDILNKKANNENLPNKFKVVGSDIVFTLNKNNGLYAIEDGTTLGDIFDLERCSLDEIEIIEENQDIDIQNIEELDAENYSYNTEITIAILEQQNQILKWAKQLDRQINNN